jgi:hypothetical protein
VSCGGGRQPGRADHVGRSGGPAAGGEAAAREVGQVDRARIQRAQVGNARKLRPALTSAAVLVLTIAIRGRERQEARPLAAPIEAYLSGRWLSTTRSAVAGR